MRDPTSLVVARCVPVADSTESLPFFFFNDTATTEIYTLSLHDALPICVDQARQGGAAGCRPGLHGLPSGAHRPGGLAAQRVADAGPQAILRGNLLRPRGQAGAGRLPYDSPGDRAGLEGGPGHARR